MVRAYCLRTTFIKPARDYILMPSKVPFNVIPAIDLKDGKAVSLVQGIPGTGITPIEDPIEVAADWVGQGAKTLHIIDLDGALSGKRKNAYILEEIVAKFKVDVQVGGGIRAMIPQSNCLVWASTVSFWAQQP
jgi:phosphoribosylformimino-5-aminoimidazole carboxamide ribonucleotide (ProFAR) isomerase